MEARVTALEKAIADPSQHGSLESIIVELARIATKEADAAARHAVLEAHKAAQQGETAVRKESTAALEAEKVEAAALRQVIDGAKAALKQAEAALKDERRATEAVNREVAAARRELAVAQESLEQAQSGRVNDRREMDAAVSAAERERDNARRDLQSVRDELDAARRELDDLRRDADTRKETHSQSHAQQEEALRAADAAAKDADQATRAAQEAARTAENAVRAAEDAARAAEARLEGAIQDRDAARDESARLKRQLEAAEVAIRESQAVTRELQAAHEARDAAEVEAARSTEGPGEGESEVDLGVDLTSIAQEEERQQAIERRTHALELALREAETRAESAEQELDRHRQAARGEPSAVRVDIPAASEPAATAESSEQFRGPARGARRVAFKADISVQIDGNLGKLVDLSMTGAQVLTPAAINPNRLVTVTLPLGESSLVCKAKVAWSRLEPRAGQLWYRAGVQFTTADQQGLESFFSMHQP